MKQIKKKAHEEWGVSLQQIRDTLFELVSNIHQKSKYKKQANIRLKRTGYDEALQLVDRLRCQMDNIVCREHKVTKCYFIHGDCPKNHQKQFLEDKEAA